MLSEDWKVAALRARKIHKDSLSRTLELFPFDSTEEFEKYESLPSAVGETVSDFGKPAKTPIAEFYRCLSKKDLEITQMEPTVLIKHIKEDKYSCFDVLKSYFHAAILASKLTNCVYEFLPEESLQKCSYLDKYKSGIASNLPLFGLPVSLKEMIPLKGHSVTSGSLCFLDREVDYNADIVDILLSKGAIPFVRTTNPQCLMMLECESFTHGRTVNPYNSNLTSGGSSGGEGALNGLQASPIGFGSDIGGSIRCPAAFNGIYGLRTTVGRLPTADYFSCQMGSESILSVTGPLTRSLDTLELLTKTIIDSEPWLVDPSLTPIRWQGCQNKKKYRIGILKHDGVVQPHPPIIRALEKVEKRLIELPNVEVFEYKPFDHAKALEIILSLYFEDGGDDIRKTLTATGEPMCPQTEWVLSNKQVKRLTTEELWYWNSEKQKYRKQYLRYWRKFNNANGTAPMDAIIAPVFPGVAAKHHTAKYWGYTAQWNLLDYPVLVFPVTSVDLEVDQPISDYKPLNQIDQFVHEQYDSPESFADAPANLGIVGLRNSEEMLIDIGKLLRDSF